MMGLFDYCLIACHTEIITSGQVVRFDLTRALRGKKKRKQQWMRMASGLKMTLPLLIYIYTYLVVHTARTLKAHDSHRWNQAD